MEHWADYLIFVIFIASSMGIGLYHGYFGWRKKSTEQFIMADRKLRSSDWLKIPVHRVPFSDWLRSFPVDRDVPGRPDKYRSTGPGQYWQKRPTILMVSFLSAILILGSPAEVFRYGTARWLMICLGELFGLIFVVQLVVPWLYPLKLTSVYSYLEMRYPGGKALKLFTVILGIIAMLFYLGAVTYGPAIALKTATGLPLEVSIPTMAALGSTYTALGGMKAVVWTDVFQTLVMVAGMLSIIIKGSFQVGGLSRAFRICEEHGRINWLDFNPDPTVRHTLFGFIFGGTMMKIKTFGIHQASVQRYSAIESVNKAKLMLLLMLPLYTIILSSTMIIGVILFANYTEDRCDPLASKRVPSANQLLPLYVKDYFRDYPGFSGLFMATLFSGALSSISSVLSGCAAIMWKDVIGLKFPNMPEKTSVLVNKVLIALFGLISIGIAYLAAAMPGHILQVTVAFSGAVGGPLLGIFIVAGTRKLRFVGSKCLLVGAASAFALTFWVILGSMSVKKYSQVLPPTFTDQCQPPFNGTISTPKPITGLSKLYTLSYLWYGPLGVLVTIVVGMICAGLYKCKHRSASEKVEVADDVFINYSNLFRILVTTMPIRRVEDVTKKYLTENVNKQYESTL